MKNDIMHSGVIERIEHPFIFVRILQQSACSGCHAKSACTAADSQVKTIEVKDYSGNYHLNEEVHICGSYSLGLQAVGLAFVVPLFLVVATLVLVRMFTVNELVGSLIGVFILIPYYAIIYLMRDKLKKKFTFTLSKIN